MRHSTTPAGLRLLLALAVVLAMLAVACGASDEDSTTSGDSFAPEADMGASDSDDLGVVDVGDEGGDAMEDSAARPGDDGDELGSGGGGVPSDLTTVQLGREIIFTATLSIEVDDVAAAGREATMVIEDLGGFVFGQNTTGGPDARSELTFKVLPEDFGEALERLGSIGELRNQTITTDDVTERVVDLESRIEVARLGAERLRTAMEEATDLEDFARLEGLLLARESDLEVMRGQLRTLRDRIDLATITLVLSQDRVQNAVALVVTAYEGHDGGASCPGDQSVNTEKGSETTICFEVINAGDQTLIDLTLTDTVLEIDDTTELLPVFDSLDELAPGQSAMVAFEFEADRSQRLRTRVVGTPTDGVTREKVGPSVNTTSSFEVRVFEPERDPGFGDGWDAAGSLLRGLWTVVTVTVGFLLPMLVLLPLVAIAWFGLRRVRSRGRRQPPPPGPQAGSPVGPNLPADD